MNLTSLVLSAVKNRDGKKSKLYQIKFISSTSGAEIFYANVSIGYAQGMYYLSSSGLECKVKNKRTIDAKITS